MNKRVMRISILWVIIMVGLIYHTLLHLVPLFYGISIEKVGAVGVMPQSMVYTFGLSFLVPVVAIVVVNYSKSFIAWVGSIVLALFALLVNTGHLAEFFVARHFDPTQLFVIIPLFFMAVLLVLDVWKLKNDK